jgi:hypothetical protein
MRETSHVLRFEKIPAREDKNYLVRRAFLAAVLLLAGCGAEQSDLAEELERVKRSSMGPVYWLGSSFEGLPLTDIEEGPGGPFFVYGECNGERSGDSFHCTGPQVRVYHEPIVNPDRYPEHFSCTRMTIRGVPAARFSGFQIYTGELLIKVDAPTPAQVRRAAAALQTIDGSAGPGAPLPPPAIDVDKGLERCALESLDAKFAELREHARMPLLWAGRRFEELRLFRVEGDGRRFARFMYGGCETPEVAGSCWPTLTIEVTPLADDRPAGWSLVGTGARRCDRLQIRGAEAAYLPYAHVLYVFTGPVAVALMGPERPLLRRAAEALRPFEGAATFEQLPPPSDQLRDELQRVCG